MDPMHISTNGLADVHGFNTPFLEYFFLRGPGIVTRNFGVYYDPKWIEELYGWRPQTLDHRGEGGEELSLIGTPFLVVSARLRLGRGEQIRYGLSTAIYNRPLERRNLRATDGRTLQPSHLDKFSMPRGGG